MGLDITGSLTEAGGVGALLATNDGINTNFPTYDGNGNITTYIDSSDNVNYSCSYTPFGKAIEEAGTKPASFGFSTKPYDEETGLNYYRYRYYNPTLGRWLNRDPIGEKGGINLFAMVSNDPINNIDQLGLKEGDCCNRKTGEAYKASDDNPCSCVSLIVRTSRRGFWPWSPSIITEHSTNTIPANSGVIIGAVISDEKRNKKNKYCACIKKSLESFAKKQTPYSQYPKDPNGREIHYKVGLDVIKGPVPVVYKDTPADREDILYHRGGWYQERHDHVTYYTGRINPGPGAVLIARLYANGDLCETRKLKVKE